MFLPKEENVKSKTLGNLADLINSARHGGKPTDWPYSSCRATSCSVEPWPSGAQRVEQTHYR